MQAYGGFAKLYDPLMRDVDYDEWAAYLLSFLKQAGSDTVDCACGTGEITLRLAKAGRKVTGVDISPEMLEIAAEKAREAGLFIPFVAQDMRRLRLHRPADAIVCACDGVNYLASREAAAQFFQAAHQTLKPGGILLFDVSSRYKLSTVLGNNTFAEDDGDRAYIWRNAYDVENRLIKMDLTFFHRRGELYARFEETHIQRAHSLKELIHGLERAGFESQAYDAFTLDAPKEESERIQFVAVKRP